MAAPLLGMPAPCSLPALSCPSSPPAVAMLPTSVPHPHPHTTPPHTHTHTHTPLRQVRLAMGDRMGEDGVPRPFYMLAEVAGVEEREPGMYK